MSGDRWSRATESPPLLLTSGKAPSSSIRVTAHETFTITIGRLPARSSQDAERYNTIKGGGQGTCGLWLSSLLLFCLLSGSILF